MSEQKQRIWELDALRGLCILCMIVIHFIYDLVAFGGLDIRTPVWYDFIQQYGHLFFVLISGICATLASRSFQRGVVDLGAGLLISYVTLFMDYVLGFSGMRIWFGVLHMLGLCMMLYPLCKRFPAWLLFVLGGALAALGFWLQNITVSVDFLFPLGLTSETFYCGSDFFPILPGFGWFLVGAGLGKTLYRRKQTLLPRFPSNFFPLNFFRFCGRHSLEIYLLHQPIVAGIVMLIFL